MWRSFSPSSLVLFLITAVRGNQGAVALQQDILGTSSASGAPGSASATTTSSGSGFMIWVGAIILFGVIGRVMNLDKTFVAFIYLIVAVFLLKQQGIFDQFTQALQSVVAPPAASPAAAGAQNTIQGSLSTPVAAPASPIGAAAGAAASVIPGAAPILGTIGRIIH